MMGFGDGWFGMGFMWVFWLLLLAGLILVIVVVVRATAGGIDRGPRNPDPTARAREILAERYARGELSDEEYSNRLRTLREG